MTSTLLDWNIKSANRISHSLGEPQQLKDKRKQAVEKLESSRWPNLLQEPWRRTNPNVIGKKKFLLWNNTMDPAPREEDTITPACCSWYHLHNGRPLNTMMIAEHLDFSRVFGSLFGSLADAFGVNGNPKLAELIQAIPDDDHDVAIRLANTAFYQGGFYLAMPEHIVASRPIWVRHTADTPGGALFPLNVIQLAKGSEATLMLENIVHGEEASWFNNLTTVEVADDAKLHLTLVNSTSPSCRFYDHLEVKLGRNAQCNISWADMTKGWAVVRREVVMAGQGSELNLRGVHVGREDSHYDCRTLQDHLAPNSFSDLKFKTAMFGRSKSIFQGMINVHPTAINANAYQLNRNLLMSKDAKTDTIPMLEILVDEVKCTHGASAGKIDPEALFYLMSRGLSETDATELLVGGFLGEIGDKLSEGAIKNYWMNRVFEVTKAVLK